MREPNWKLLVLTGVFLTMLAASTFISSKLTVMFGLLFSVGGISYALTFPCVDIMTETYGRRAGLRFVVVGLVGHLLSLALMWVALRLPGAPIWDGESAYVSTFERMPKFVVAGIAAYLLSQIVNVTAFEAIREMTRGRRLWLRSIASTAVAQVIDTAIFVPLAFMNVLPETIDLLYLALGQLAIKVALGAAATPLVYLGVEWLGEPRRPLLMGERGVAVEVRAVKVSLGEKTAGEALEESRAE